MHSLNKMALVALLGAVTLSPRVFAAAAAAPSNVELTADSAKRSIDAYLQLREKYGRKVPAANHASSIAKKVNDDEGVRAIVTAKGFPDIADFEKTIASVASAAQSNNGGTFDAKIAEIEANKNIQPDLRERMISVLKAARPSENNLKIVKELADDPTYGPKLQQLERKQAPAKTKSTKKTKKKE